MMKSKKLIFQFSRWSDHSVFNLHCGCTGLLHNFLTRKIVIEVLRSIPYFANVLWVAFSIPSESLSLVKYPV
jgi:hypothetical protein